MNVAYEKKDNVVYLNRGNSQSRDNGPYLILVKNPEEMAAYLEKQFKGQEEIPLNNLSPLIQKKLEIFIGNIDQKADLPKTGLEENKILQFHQKNKN
jgi:hypothetical protein